MQVKVRSARRQRQRRQQCLPATRTPLSIRFADVDMMKVVHHSAYLHWFEKIRFNALDRVFGISFATLDRLGLALPLTSVEIHYHRGFRFTDQPVGYSEIEIFKKAMFAVHYFIYRDDSLYTTGTTRHCYLDRDGRMLVRTPDIVRQAFERAVDEYPGWVRRRED